MSHFPCLSLFVSSRPFRPRPVGEADADGGIDCVGKGDGNREGLLVGNGTIVVGGLVVVDGVGEGATVLGDRDGNGKSDGAIVGRLDGRLVGGNEGAPDGEAVTSSQELHVSGH